MRLLSLVTALTIAGGSLVAAACSGGSSSPGSESASATASRSFRGTYTADSDEGASPFASLTFEDGSRYQAIARFCNPSTQSAASCARSGSFAVAGTDLVLTEDGSGTTLQIPLDGATTASRPDSVGLRPDDLVVVLQGGDAGGGRGGGDLVIDIQSALLNGVLILSFPVNGTGMSSTGGASSTGSTADAGSDGGTSGVSIGDPGSGSPGGGDPGSGTPGSGDPGGGMPGSASDGGTSLVTAGPVAQALLWVAAKMPYCGGVQNGPDAICGGTCRRTGAANNPAWNPYRSDCSGLVSFAWGLPAPGLTTKEMAPLSRLQSTAVPGNSLQPGDALNSGTTWSSSRSGSTSRPAAPRSSRSRTATWWR